MPFQASVERESYILWLIPTSWFTSSSGDGRKSVRLDSPAFFDGENTPLEGFLYTFPDEGTEPNFRLHEGVFFRHHENSLYKEPRCIIGVSVISERDTSILDRGILFKFIPSESENGDETGHI